MFLLLEHIETLTLKGRCLQSGNEDDSMFLFPINLKKLNIQFEKIDSNQAQQIMHALKERWVDVLYIDAQNSLSFNFLEKKLFAAISELKSLRELTIN
jgi:hypothetical protein